MYLPSTTRTMLETRLARYETMLAAAYDAMDSAATGMHIQRYEFDSGEGRQEVIAIRPGELANHISWLERMIAHISQRLTGTGVVNLTMKRKYR